MRKHGRSSFNHVFLPNSKLLKSMAHGAWHSNASCRHHHLDDEPAFGFATGSRVLAPPHSAKPLGTQPAPPRAAGPAQQSGFLSSTMRFFIFALMKAPI